MNTSAIWGTTDLRAQWERAITPKYVDFFERFVRAPNPDGFKTKRQHYEDTKITYKLIDRPNESLVEFLKDVGLIRLERRGELLRVEPIIPVSVTPPDVVKLPTHASFTRGNRKVFDRRRLYDLDGGLCAYCGKVADYGNFELDHIYPFNKNGADDEQNLTVQCAECRKGYSIPGDKRWLEPSYFRGKRVKSVKFVERGGFKYPEFEFEDG